MNCYATLTQIKSRLGIPTATTTYDSDLLMLLNAASRALDLWCNREFYTMAETRYFNGSSSPLFVDDLLSITASSFKLDEDGDGTFESTLATTDYILYPLSRHPKTYVKVTTGGNYGGFASGIPKGVEIVGSWGFGNETDATPYRLSTTTINADLTASATSVSVASGTPFSVGHTILIDSEQMYVTAVVTNTLTVVRGVNGTTAATHTSGATVYIYEYPDPIVEACLIQAMRWWKRKDSSFATQIGSPEMGLFEVYKGLDADVKLVTEAYHKRNNW